MSSILRGLNENVQIEENSSAELTAKLDKVESILGTRTDMKGRQFNQAIQDITKNVKYLQQDELVMEIYSKIRDIAEAIGFPEKVLEDAEDDVRKAFTNLEQAVYKLEEPFEDFVRDLQYKVEELEEIDEGQRCWKGYKKKGTKKMFGKTVNNCVKADESVKPGYKSAKNTFDDLFNDKKLDEFQRGSFDDDKPKRPSKGKLVTKDGMPVTLPLRTEDFRGDPIVIVDYIPPHKPSSTGRIVTDDGMTYFPGVADLKIIGHQFDVDEGLAGAASGAYLGSKIAGLPGAVAGGVLGHQATKEGKKSRIGSVMEMYDDHLFLIYINGKLAAETPIEKKQKNQYERVIKSALPDAEVTFKATPRHYYSAEELAEGSGRIRAGLAGILLIAGLLGINNHEAQKVYAKSHQLQQLTQIYMVAKERGDEAKMKEVKRRIGNHKLRLDLGKGDVDFDGLPGKDDVKDIDYINTPGEK